MQTRETVFNVPGVDLALLAILIAIHAGRQFLSLEDSTWTLLAMAFIPARYSGMAADLPGGDVASVTSFATHMFAHADAVHLAINGMWLLAFGSVLARRMGGPRFLLFALACGIAGALLFLVMHPGLVAPVIGASGAIAGLMGGVMRFLFSAIDRGIGYRLREDPASIPLMDLKTALTDRRLVLASAIFVAVNLLALIGFGTFGAAGSIAWEAHLGGYFFGLLTFGYFDPAPQHHVSHPPQCE